MMILLTLGREGLRELLGPKIIKRPQKYVLSGGYWLIDKLICGWNCHNPNNNTKNMNNNNNSNNNHNNHNNHNNNKNNKYNTNNNISITKTTTKITT